MEAPKKSIFSGMVKFTTIDDFGHIGATLFTGGCNFRCFYCHNPDFVIPERVNFLPLEEVLDFLNKRKNLLETIILCGGEPTLHPEIVEWARYIKSLGFRIKLDSNATITERFRRLIDENLVDFAAIDYKASKKNYEKVVNVKINVDTILENIKYLIEKGVDYEIRTTIHPSVHNEEEILQMIKELKEIGVENYYLQIFKMPPETVGEAEDLSYDEEFVKKFKKILEENFKKSGIRNE